MQLVLPVDLLRRTCVQANSRRRCSGDATLRVCAWTRIRAFTNRHASRRLFTLPPTQPLELELRIVIPAHRRTLRPLGPSPTIDPNSPARFEPPGGAREVALPKRRVAKFEQCQHHGGLIAGGLSQGQRSGREILGEDVVAFVVGEAAAQPHAFAVRPRLRVADGSPAATASRERPSANGPCSSHNALTSTSVGVACDGGSRRPNAVRTVLATCAASGSWASTTRRAPSA